VVLGDAERPADHGPLGLREVVGELADRLGRYAGLALGVLERVRLDGRPVRLELGGRAADELAVVQPGRDDLPTDRVGERDVAADIKPKPGIRPFGRRSSTWIDRVQPRAVAHPAQQVVEEDRMRLAGVAAPQDDQVRVFDFTI
jgi:hypothetical protein